MRFLDAYINFLRKRHIAVLALLLAGTLFFGWQLAGIGFEGSFEGWIEKDDPLIEDYRELLRRFPAFEAVILAVEAEDTIFKPEVIKKLKTLNSEIRTRNEYVMRTLGLPNMSVMKKTSGGVSFDYLYRDIPETQEEAEEFRRLVMSNRTLSDLLVSNDEKSTYIAIFIGGGGPDFDVIPQHIGEIKKIMSEQRMPGVKYHLVGGPILNEELKRHTKLQAYTFSPLVFALITLLLIVLLRRAADIAIVVAATFCSVVWSLGLYVGAGHELHSLSVALPPLLLVISVADAVHLIVRFREEAGRGKRGTEAVGGALRLMFLPCLFTSVTTAAGFGVLCLSGIPIIREFGLYAAAGLMITFFVSLTMVPSLLFLRQRLTGAPAGSDGGARNSAQDFLHSTLDKIFGLVIRRGNVIIAVAVIIIIVSIAGATRIKVETNRADFFRKSHPLRRQMAFVEERLIGLTSIEFLFSAQDGGDMTSAGALRDMLELQEFLRANEHITSVISIADFVADINAMLTGRREVPDNAAHVLSMIRRNRIEYSFFVFQNGRNARVSGRLKYIPTEELQLLLKDIDEYLAANESPDYDVLVTGVGPIYTGLADRVLEGQIRSFALVMAIVAVMMILLFRSLRWGLFALAPNVIPVLFVMGVMGWFGVTLNLATMMIASIAIGIAVDDTIHFIVRFRRELAESGDHREAARRALTTTGRAVVTTTVVLIAGYGILMVSSFVPIAHFGLLSAVTMFAALAADVLLLPALLIKLKPRP